jgi:CheY-like chemotaxis protein
MHVRRVLLVEDEYLLATGIADEFAQLGVETVGPAGSVKQALELVEHGGRFDAAVLDSNLRGDVVYGSRRSSRARRTFRLRDRIRTAGDRRGI